MRYSLTTLVALSILTTRLSAQSATTHPRFHVDITAGLAVPLTPEGLRDAKTGPDLLIGVSYRLSPIVDWRVYGEAVLFLEPGGPDYLSFGQSSGQSTLAFAPLLSLFTGPRVALSPASTHMYLQGSVGVLAPSDDLGTRTALAGGIGVGIRSRRVFGEFSYTHGFAADNGSPSESIGYASFRFGVSLGSR